MVYTEILGTVIWSGQNDNYQAFKIIFELNELIADSIFAKFAHTADDGKEYQTYFCNLDAIITIGYQEP